MFKHVSEVSDALARNSYLADQELATAVYLAIKLNKPLLVEGPAGAGKTELGKVLALATGASLTRLQCFEGLDESKALYEWNYQMQLLYLQSQKILDWEHVKEGLYSADFLLERPLLKALRATTDTVLLIDEIDKSDDEFESFLLEALAEFQVTIPEFGTIHAKRKPMVVITSNNTRLLSDALRRRCLYCYIDYPDFEREFSIIKLKVPDLIDSLAQRAAVFIQTLRRQDLKKPPGISEVIDWAQTLVLLEIEILSAETLKDTLPVLLKHNSDLVKVRSKLDALVQSAKSFRVG